MPKIQEGKSITQETLETPEHKSCKAPKAGSNEDEKNAEHANMICLTRFAATNDKNNDQLNPVQ